MTREIPHCREVLAADATDNRSDDNLCITLDETDRHRRRKRLVSDQGLEFLLELPSAVLLRDGDALLLDDGRQVRVRAEAEALYEVRARDSLHLLTLAWQLGNRHLPTEIREDSLRIRKDHVIAEMLATLGAEVRDIVAGFNPEGGAYAADGGKSVHAHHDHEHAHHHSHGHGHDHHHK